jgi:hypothetical protein
VRHPVLLLVLIPALALAACGDDGPEIVEVDQAEACRAVKERLKLTELEDRFGKPDSQQDFFGDTVVAYEDDDAEGVKWQLQVSAQSGTFRAQRVEGRREEQIDCPN